MLMEIKAVLPNNKSPVLHKIIKTTIKVKIRILTIEQAPAINKDQTIINLKIQKIGNI